MCYKSVCCGSCLFSRPAGDTLECGKRRMGRLIVDVFFCCPMWRRKRGADE